MTICQYYQRGTCAFGDKCRFEHPGHVTAYNKNNNRSSVSVNRGQRQAPAFSSDSIKLDFTTDRPTWPLSSYGPAKNEPNLLQGLDVSPEELQLKYYQARQMNDASKYPEAEMLVNVENNIKNVLSNLRQAYEHATNLHNQAFNTNSNTNTFQNNAFGGTTGQTAATASSAFGKSAFGSSAFGSSAFGASSINSNNNTPAFGTSAFGSAGSTAPAYGGNGTASAFGASTSPTKSAFGAFSSQNNAAPAFGTSTFGQTTNATPSSASAPAFGTSAFGQAPATSIAPVFGSSSLGQALASSPQTSAFGVAAAVPTGSTFGTPSFGQSGFGTKSQQNAFGAQQASSTNAFLSTSSGGGFGNFGGMSNTAFGQLDLPAPTAAPTTGFTTTAPNASGQSAFGSSAATPNALSSDPTIAGAQKSGWSAFSSVQPNSNGGFGSVRGLEFSGQSPQRQQLQSITSSNDPYRSSAPQVSELSKDDIEAYQASEFLWERGWPSIEPPLEMR